MPRRVERIAVTIFAERGDDGNIVKRIGSISFTTFDPSPAPGSKAIDTSPFSGRAPGPAFVGSMTLNQLLQEAIDIAKSEGNAV